jgi:hypothetical protein
MLSMRKETIHIYNRVLKNGVYGLDPALCGFCKCSHITQYAALCKTPQAFADSLILVFRHPVRVRKRPSRHIDGKHRP